MTEIERFEVSRIPEFLGLWHRFFPARYHVGESVLRANTVDCPVFDWGLSSIAFANGKPAAMALLKKSAAPNLYPGDQDQAHLSAFAFTDVTAAVDLLAEAKQMLRDRGIRTLVYGMDSRHFFPGCPVDTPLLNSFLTVEGFEYGDEFVDLERDLQGYANPFPTPAGVEIRPVKPSELPAVDEFLTKEFPGRWTHDVRTKAKAEGPEESIVAAFQGEKVVGFALIQRQGCKLPIGGAVWNQDLGENWGALGPIGVAKSQRKRGLGNAVLGEALAELCRRGARRTIIDWTTLVDFYGGHGFEVTRTYRSARLTL